MRKHREGRDDDANHTRYGISTGIERVHGRGAGAAGHGRRYRGDYRDAVAVSGTGTVLRRRRPPSDELPRLLKLGDRITVTDDTGRELQGELIDLSPSALSVLVDERHDLQETDSAGKTWCPNGWRCSIGQTIAQTRRYDLRETEITGITQRRADSLKDGALRGFISGAAIISVLVLSSGCSVHPAGMLAAIGAYGGLGAGIGAAVDSAHVGSRVVYDTRGSSRRVSVSPLISRDRTGVAVSLGF